MKTLMMVVTVVFFLTGCAGLAESAKVQKFNKEEPLVFEIINIYGYIADGKADVNYILAKDLWDVQLTVKYFPRENNVFAYYDTEEPNVIFLNDEIEKIKRKHTIEDAVEIAAVISGLGYIRQNHNDPDVLKKAYDYAVASYESGKQKYIIDAAKKKIEDPHGFSEWIKKANPIKSTDNKYLWMCDIHYSE